MQSYNEYKQLINDRLLDYLPEIDPFADTVRKSMSYSLECGGKRLRPVLLLASCEFAGGSVEEALPYACALEYIHTYSLIHDDLPALDNDDYRRGNLTNHKVFGENMAILAGDGLLSTAAQVLSDQALKHAGNADKLFCHVKAGNQILTCAGVQGMVGGQVADVENECREATADLVEFIHANKTGKLLKAPVLAGLALAGADERTTELLSDYAACIGKAFQISDDILDEVGDQALVGKTLGKDKEQGKCSYVHVHGMDAAVSKLHSLTSQALSALDELEGDTTFFRVLALQLETRKA